MPADAPAKKCGWCGCEVVLADRREGFCDRHKEPGSALLRSARNARYAGAQRRLVAHALTPDPTEDGGVILPAPVVERLADAAAQLDRAVKEFDQGVQMLRAWELDGHLEGWAELKTEHELRLRFALALLRKEARNTLEVLGPVLGSGDGVTGDRVRPDGPPA